MARRVKRSILQAPEGLGDIVERASESRFARQRGVMPRRAWVSVVGQAIADRTEPISLRDGVLSVRTATAAWAAELSLLGEDLRARLAAQGVVARELRFHVGPLSIERPLETRKTRRVPPPAPLPEEMAKALPDVLDDELRDIIGNAARHNLAWQGHVGQRSAARRSSPSKR